MFRWKNFIGILLGVDVEQNSCLDQGIQNTYEWIDTHTNIEVIYNISKIIKQTSPFRKEILTIQSVGLYTFFTRQSDSGTI